MKKTGLFRYIRGYRSQSMLVKSFVLVSVSVITVLACMFILTYNLTHRLIDDSVFDMNETLVNQTVTTFESVLDESTRIGASLLNSSQTHRFIFMDLETVQYNQELVLELSANTRAFLLIFDYLHSIYLYSEGSEFLVTHDFHGPFESFRDDGWFEAYMRAYDFEIPAISRTFPDGYPYLMSIILPYYFIVTEKLGTAVVNINMAQLDRILQGQGRFGQQQVFITDHNGFIIYSRDRSQLAADINDIINMPGGYGRATAIVDSAQSGRYIVTNAPLRNRGWRLVSVLPLTVYDNHFYNLARAMQLLIAVLIVLGITATVVITLKLYSPVKNAIKELEQHGILGSLGEGRLTEMEHIKSVLLTTAQDNQALKTETEKRLALLEQAQAGALQAQIRPHFLSNTMDAIRWGAIKLGGGENDVSLVIHKLSQLLRLSLNMKEMLVSIREEIEYTKAYVEIMTYRNTNIVLVNWEIDEEILDLAVLKLSFQPIIENAIYHGIKPKKSHGEIKITGELIDGEVRIRFVDNGVGIKPEDADNINRQLSSAEALNDGNHVGMHNVNQRIKLMFGVKYGAKIICGEKDGVVVELNFPAAAVSDERSLIT